MATTQATLTVGDLKAMLESIPDDMPLFAISDYEGYCEPATSLPNVEQVSELEFPHGTSFHNGATDGLIPHKVLRNFKVLRLS